MLPVVIYEESVRVFNFYHNGTVHQGMSHWQRLYKLIKTFEAQGRSQAYMLGCELSHQGCETVITVSGNIYKVWAELRSDAEPASVEPSHSSITTLKLPRSQATPKPLAV